jgi:DNA-binding NtrC family response regulator
MRPIRSLLWIGTGQGLAESGITEAPELDVTWVPSLLEALRLPRVLFDAVLLESRETSGLEKALSRLGEAFPNVPILLSLPDAFEEIAPALLELGASAALFLRPESEGPGIVSQISETLDAVLEVQAASKSPSAFSVRLPEASRAGDASPAPAPARPADPAPSTKRVETGEAFGPAPFPRVVTRSPAMRDVFELVDQAASSPSTVLVTGETGVGKEIIARALHARSGRRDEPFVAINCAAFPEALLESELFGHSKGAFTGADRAKVGLFEAAGAGTLFLDEIAETDLPLQAKLLRVLQEREIRPVGSNRQTRIHCRIVAATNRTLAEEVREGHFREDLFYRLNVFPIRIPPLRERKPDILPLARHFLEMHGPREGKVDCHLSLATSHLLEAYTWPGNVRELENEILRILMLTPTGQLITPKALSPKIVEILEPVGSGARPDESLKQALDRIEAWMIRRALSNNGGGKTRTAKRLGLTREGLYKKMKRLGVE